jgi:RimJ/RimL family protein N-acetyltransferase
MIISSKVILRDKKLADAPDDYAWVTDPELAHLDAAPLLTTTFARYLSDYTSQLHYSPRTRHQFAIDTLEGKHIGNCVYYGVNKTKGEAELGIMIGDRNCWDKGYGADAVTTLVSHIFHQTDLKRIYLKTLDSNNRAQKCFRKCGFIPCGHRVKGGFSFALMEIHRQQWEKQQTKT